MDIGHGESLAFFQQRTHASAIKRKFIESHLPNSTFGSLYSGITFNVESEGFFIDLYNTKLYVELAITELDPITGLSKPIGATSNVCLINLPLSSLFRRVDLSLNSVNISSSIGELYWHKAYIDSLMFSTKEEVRELEVAGYTHDTAGK